MNEILADIEDLEAVVAATKNGCGTIRTVQMLEKLKHTIKTTTRVNIQTCKGVVFPTVSALEMQDSINDSFSTRTSDSTQDATPDSQLLGLQSTVYVNR